MNPNAPIVGSAALRPSADPAHAPARSTFSNEDCLLGVIDQCISGHELSRVEVADLGAFWIWPAAGSFWLESAPSGSAFWLTPSRQARVERFAHEPAIHPRQSERPLEELLWSAAFYGSNGRLHEQCHPYDVVEMRAWPNLTRVPHLPTSARICALLTHSPATVALLPRWLHIAEADVFRVYSAARAAGLIHVRCSGARLEADAATAPSAKVAGASAKVAGFWERIVARLSAL